MFSGEDWLPNLIFCRDDHNVPGEVQAFRHSGGLGLWPRGARGQALFILTEHHTIVFRHTMGDI